MDDPESELSRFRQQWKEEVTHRVAPQPSSPSSSSSSKAKPPAPAFSSRKLSHSSASANDVSEDPEDAVSPEPSIRERSVSPTAVRRTSVSVPTVPGVPESALEHYERAVEKETQGSLGESLSLYRKAFRMDARVDTHYREKYFPRPPPGAAGPSTAKEKAPAAPVDPSAPVLPPTSLASNSKQVSALIASFAHLQIQPALPPRLDDETEPAETEPLLSPLSTLPSELLLHILRALAVTDIASFARCAQVCKALAFVVVTEQSIWRDVCAVTYSRMAWDWKCQVDGSELIDRPLSDAAPSSPPSAEDAEGEGEGEAEAEETRIPPDIETLLPAYASSYRKMLIARPRVRFNGIYISTCNYVRSGASQSGWNTPVHIVTYFRYLRFYPDGTVASLLSTHEPGDVVHAFGRAPPPPGTGAGWGRWVARGRWRVDLDGRVDVETEPPRGGSMERYLFRMQMRVRSVRAGGRAGASNKLVWEGFWSWNRLTDDLAEFSLRNDKAFFFSRVGSVERELGIV